MGRVYNMLSRYCCCAVVAVVVPLECVLHMYVVKINHYGHNNYNNKRQQHRQKQQQTQQSVYFGQKQHPLAVHL